MTPGLWQYLDIFFINSRAKNLMMMMTMMMIGILVQHNTVSDLILFVVTVTYVVWCLSTIYSLIQMKYQGGNKYALSITVKFDQSTRRFGRISFARSFKLTKRIALLFYIFSPLLSCLRGPIYVRKNMHIIKTIMKFCAHWSTVCGMTNSDAVGIQTL